jgi:A/G-specific adenine glycosylase
MIKSCSTLTDKDKGEMRELLLAWYDAEGRTLPWRVRPEDRAAGKTADPYAVWLSEIMLQQTTVPHGTPYWHKFLETFPTVTDLANAPRETVLGLWAGLGYYARARNLHKCAQIIRDDYGGVFPETEKELLKLPGIGAYTAATMAAICFDEATNIVDGNVERVISRIFAVQTPLPKGRKELRIRAGEVAPPQRAGDYGQALMDLGATVCTPRSPACECCVWQNYCAAYVAGTQTDYPKKAPKKKQPIRYGAVFLAENQGAFLVETRPDQGLLGGMLGLPGTDWESEPVEQPLQFAPFSSDWDRLDGFVRHVFTHFELRLDVYRTSVEMTDVPKGHNGLWIKGENIKTLPSVFQKAVKHKGV